MVPYYLFSSDLILIKLAVIVDPDAMKVCLCVIWRIVDLADSALSMSGSDTCDSREN